MSNNKYVVNRAFTNQVGQPLVNLNVAILVGTVNGTSEAVTASQPGSPLATVYGDPQGSYTLTNPTTPGTNTLTTDGYGNLCSIIDGVTTLGVYLNTSGYGASTFFVLQVWGPGVAGANNQQLIPLTFPSGG